MRLDQIIQGNDVVQQHVAAERGKQALTAVSPMARRAIQQEIVPQIEESVFSPESAEDLCESAKRSIEAAFSFKNEIYTRLVSYKGIDQSDQQFLEDLLIVMDEWLRSVLAKLRDERDSTGQTPPSQEASSSHVNKGQEVNVDVNVNVNGEERENSSSASSIDEEEEEEKAVQASGDELVDSLAPDANQAIPLAFEDIFDLGDVRL